MAIETIDVADALACAIDGIYHDGLNVFLTSSAITREDGRTVLLVVVETPGVPPDEEETYRNFRFLCEEVRG